MKRKRNYNKNVPNRNQSDRLRPAVSTDPGAALVDDPVKISLYTSGVLALCYGIQLIQKFIL